MERIFENIIFDREEQYDTQQLNCYAFSKRGVVKNGIDLLLGNMLNGFPIVVEGVTYPCSEILYLSGQFSNNTPEHRKIRADLALETNGYGAKKSFKSKYKNLIREDFESFRNQWMLWVVWQKTIQNNSFQNLLKSLPKNAIIIEDSSGQKNPKTSSLWGCINDMLASQRKNVAKRIDKQYGNTLKKYPLKALKDAEKVKIMDIGVFVGKNNMGKVLMLCKKALDNNIEPPIDYQLLKESKIYLNSTTPLFA